MLTLLRDTWALLFGMMLLMLGNGLQGSLLGVRGGIEGFSASEMSVVMSGFFLGFLLSSRATPGMIRRVGHVRVFAAMGSIISAMFILYAAFPNVWAWAVMRVVVGACFASVYVVAESWLNDAATNETRGKALSLYMIVQLTGFIAAQALLGFGDPAGYGLFVAISVLVSLSFAPILLSVSPAPVHQTTKPMSLVNLFRASPLGVVGVFFMGAVFSALMGMASVYGTERGFAVTDIALFVSLIFAGGLAAQYPAGWLSDRMDRRLLILIFTALGAGAGLFGATVGASLSAALFAAFAVGAVAHPLHSLLVAHTNDFLEPDDMAAAAGGMLFLTGLGAVAGPLAVGAAMEALGPGAFFGFLALMFGAVSLYAAWRMTRRPAVPAEDASAYAYITPAATAVAADYAAEFVAEQAEAAAEAEAEQQARSACG
jgi:MFS family permease